MPATHATSAVPPTSTAPISTSRGLAALLAAVCLCGLGVAIPRPAAAQAYGERSAVVDTSCQRACLIGFARRYMDALVHHDPSRVPFAKDVRFTENDVELRIGQGLWGSISSASTNAMLAADPDTGNVAWFGTVEEHGSPAYYAMRLRVRDGRICEVETVLQRKTGLPAPFGDPSKLVHDPAFQQVLPPAERRGRQRLRDVANGYFSTVERNDGDVLTLFDADCQRTENGISTTRGSFGSAADAQGCVAQFRLGLFRINKRVRERRYPLIDVERGVVVATGFFDHDNSFDHYRTTDGKMHRTLLKWPNSLSLMEAFKIRNGRIYRVEAIFTYVPYAMHSPWENKTVCGGCAGPGATAGAHAGAQAGAHAGTASCDRACLIDLANRYMTALATHRPSSLPWAKTVRYTENSIPLDVGDGEWGSVTAKSAHALLAADPETGNVAWLGVVEEHGDPAYYGVRLEVRDRKIAGVESVIEPQNDLAPFGNPTAFARDASVEQTVPRAERRSRAELLAAAGRYYDSLPKKLPPGALDVRLRALHFPLVDVEHGLVVATVFMDHAATDYTPPVAAGGSARAAAGKSAAARRPPPWGTLPHNLDTPYPLTLGLLQALEIRGDKVVRVETIATLLPYYMPTPWGR